MKTISKKVIVMALVAALICALCTVAAFAATSDNAANATAVTETAQTAETAGSATGSKAVAAAVCVGLAIGKSAEGISRQPEAAGNIRTSLMLGLVFIETVVIYALIIAILVIFVL